MPDISSRYNLITAENRLVSQYAQDPNSARVLENLIPSRAGDLKRKTVAPEFTSGDPPAGGWFSFAQEYLFYVPTTHRQIIIAESTNLGTWLYKFQSGGSLAQLPTGAYSPPHNPVSGWIGDPLILYSDGLLFISDGTAGANGTIYDGQNTWKWGLDRPNTLTNVNESSPGSIDINADLFREWVITEYDSVQKRESIPSDPIRFTASASGSFDFTLDFPARVNTATGWTAGAADFFRVYASRNPGSTEYFWIADVAATDSPQAGALIDTVPFWGAVTTAMRPFRPPVRNQKKQPSLIGAKWNNRIILRDETRKTRAWVSGAREILAQSTRSVGNPLEFFPGTRNAELEAADVEARLLSDFDNFIELPDESYEQRAMLWWQDGLMIGTERAVTILWGRNPEEWSINNSSTYGFGLFGKNSFIVTPHGLVMFTADRKLVMDPVTGPSGGDRTGQVQDIGWPIQPELNDTDPRFSNRFQMRYFPFGSERDWLVVNFTTQLQGIGKLKIFDFEAPGWYTPTDVEGTCVGIITEDEGYKFLVAGNSVADRKLRVVTDFGGSGTLYDAAATRVGLPAPSSTDEPQGIFKTALLDLQQPQSWKVWEYLTFYRKGTFTPTVKVWFDPEDVDNLDPADAVELEFETLRTNEFRSWIWEMSKRMIIEFTIPSGGGAGALQGLELAVDPITISGV